VRSLVVVCIVLQIHSFRLQENVHANGFFENILCEHLLAACASTFRPFAVTSIGGSVDEQIPSQLSHIRGLRVQAAAHQAVPRHVSPFP
jgi:hypothetical protein